MPEFSLDQLTGPTPAAPASGGEFSFDPATGGLKPATTVPGKPTSKYGTSDSRMAGGLKGLRSAGREATAVGDMLLGFPASLMELGFQGGSRVRGFFENLTQNKGRTQQQQADDAFRAREHFSRWIEESTGGLAHHPLKTAFGDLLKEDGKDVEGAVEHTMGRVSALIEKGGDFIQHHTGLPTKDFQMVAEGIIDFGAGGITQAGVRGVKGLVNKLKSDPATGPKMAKGQKPTEEELKDVTQKYADSPEGQKNPVRPESGAKIVEGWMKADQDIKTHDIAYDLIQRGASRKEVMQAIKKYKDLPIEKTMDEIMAKRRATMEGASGDLIETDPQRPGAAPARAGVSPDSPGRGEGTPALPAPSVRPPLKQLGGVDRGAVDKLENMLPEAAKALGPLLAGRDTTLKTLERLPPNKVEFTKQQVQEQMNRADVPLAEKNVLASALESVEGDKITAKQLTEAVDRETKEFKLTEKASSDYAEYGLDRIGRIDTATAEEAQYHGTDTFQGRKIGPENTAHGETSRVWELPTKIDIENHFGSENYFGHTRAFEDAQGTPHIIEIQSDLVQNLGKPLPEAERATLQAERRTIQRQYDDLSNEYAQTPITDTKKTGEIGNKLDQLDARIAEIANKLSRAETAAATQHLQPMAKNWERRLIREELSRASRQGKQVVRFADADTVAKVEGWPKEYELHEDTTSFEPSIKGNRIAGYSTGTMHDWVSTGQVRGKDGQFEQLLRAIDAKGREMPETKWRTVFPEELSDVTKKDLIKSEKLSPEHQGIYDRYKKDITKFLKSLGGKEVKDEMGHGWIEVPVTPKEFGGARTQMFGGVDPKLLETMGAIGLGALVGGILADDHKFEGAVAGMAAGVLGRNLREYTKTQQITMRKALPEVARAGIVVGGLAALNQDHPVDGAMLGLLLTAGRTLPKAVVPKIGDMTIEEHINLMQGTIAVRERDATRFRRVIDKEIPDKRRQEAVSVAIDKGDLSSLTPREREIAKAWKNYTDIIGKEAKDLGVLDDLLENYVTHIVDRKGLPESAAQKALDVLGLGPARRGGGSGSSQFTKRRKYATFAELQKALEGTGLEIKTMELGEIAEIYGKSMTRAIERKRLANTLEKAKIPDADGLTYIMKADRAPQAFKQIDVPALRGMAVHPDLAPHLKFTMGARTTNELARGLVNLSNAQKRLSVSMSLFHATNLGFAAVQAMGWYGLKELGKAAVGKSEMDFYRKQWDSAGGRDIFDLGIENGLHVEHLSDVDPKALQKVGGAIDDIVNRATNGKLKGVGAEKSLGGVERIQRDFFDKVTWDYLHTNLKLTTYARYMEKLTQQHPDLPQKEIARQAAAATNDFYGGLDWYRVATEAQTQWGKARALDMLNPQSRSALQILMFAPDWTMSAFRSIYKALPGNTETPLNQKLHQAYAARTAVMFFVAMNGLNYALSGHSVFENKNPFYIEDKEGNSWQVNKHGAEFAQWMAHPWKEATNKLGYIPRELLSQATGTEYLSPYQFSGKMIAGPAMKEGRAAHAAKGLTPMFLQEAVKSPSGAVTGALGVKTFRANKDDEE